MEKEEIKIRIAFYALFGILGIFILATPHIIVGHFFVSENYIQSLTIFVSISIGYLFHNFYQRKMQSLHAERAQAEKRMVHSFSYIGKMNNIIDIFKGFGRFFPHKEAGITEKEVFNTLLSNIVVSVAKADKGFVRFIDVKSGQTIKEFYFSQNRDDLRVRVSNATALEQKNNPADGISIIESDYRNTGVCCILCLPEIKKIDIELVRSLLNQTHLLYLVFKKDNI